MGNLANEEVVTEIKKIMRYWFDQGVAGFHIKDVQYLVENPEFAEETGAPGEHTKDYEGTFKVLEELRKVADEYSQKNNAKGIAGSPMQWNGGDNAGFSGRQPYIDVGDDYKTVNAKAGKAHFTDLTTIKAFKSLVKLRSDTGADEINDPESFQWGKTRVCAPNKNLFLFSRKATRFPFFAVLMNLGSGEQTVDLSSVDCVDTKQMGEVVFHASDSSQVGNVLDVHAVPANLKAGDVVVMEFE